MLKGRLFHSGYVSTIKSNIKSVSVEYIWKEMDLTHAIS